MPISNPIIQGLNVTVIQGTDITLAVTDPFAPPSEAKKFWFNQVEKTLFLAIATQSVSDWVAVGGANSGSIDWDAIANKPSVFPADAATILNKILVQNGAVVTTDDTVIFED
ncbi:MAG: hypothetical protein ACKPCM_00825 [Pseudanabaena sp.]